MREKSEMTLREAAQQALDALELGCTDHDGNPVDLVGPAITALRAALAEEQNYVNRWISVEENLPKEGQPVLGLYYKSNIRIVYRREREDIDAEWADSGSGHSLIPPTHWMPLPEYEHVHKMESKATINELETVEPVAWMRANRGHVDFHRHPDYLPLYTAPPTREPLTDCGEAGHDEGRCGNASCITRP